jgi:hypothetical protein
MTDKYRGTTSVALFRMRGIRLFHLWAYNWTVLVDKDTHVTREHSSAICTDILTHYWSSVSRNPTLFEWAENYLSYLQHGVYDPILGDRHIQLNVHNPWFRWYHAAHGDEQRALQLFSLTVAHAFLAVSHKTGTIDSSLDWTDEETIATFLTSLSMPRWKKWWNHFLTH